MSEKRFNLTGSQLTAIILNVIGIFLVFLGDLLLTTGYSQHVDIDGGYGYIEWVYPYASVGMNTLLVAIVILLVSFIMMVLSLRTHRQ